MMFLACHHQSDWALHVLMRARLRRCEVYRSLRFEFSSVGVAYRDGGTSSLCARKEGPSQLLQSD